MKILASAPSGRHSASRVDGASAQSGPTLDNRRVLAGLMDLLVVVAGVAAIFVVVGALGGGGAQATPAIVVLAIGWALYYYFALESGSGQTLGKRMMGLRVLSADGSPATMREIAVRTVLRVIDGIGLYLVGLVTMLITGERRQRLGDLAAGTIIADANASAPATGASTAAVVAAPLSEAPAPEPEDAAADEEDELSPVAVAEAQDWRPPEDEADEVDEAEQDGEEPVVLKSVEPLSAMDVVMGDAESDGQTATPHDDLDQPA